MSLSPPAPSLAKRLIRLGLALGFLVLLVYLTPFIIHSIPPLREYARVVDETGIMPGVLFYTDVPQTVDGEFNNRDAIRFRVEPGQERER